MSSCVIIENVLSAQLTVILEAHFLETSSSGSHGIAELQKRNLLKEDFQVMSNSAKYFLLVFQL